MKTAQIRVSKQAERWTRAVAEKENHSYQFTADRQLRRGIAEEKADVLKWEAKKEDKS